MKRILLYLGILAPWAIVGRFQARLFAVRGELESSQGRSRDTTVVKILRGSWWGDTVRVREELRIGGAPDSKGPVFSLISGVAIGPRDEVAVFDEVEHQLFLFEEAGSQGRPIGRVGSGPGEYRSNTGIAFNANHEIIQLDPGNRRINRYRLDGRSLPAFPVERIIQGSRGISVDSAERIFVRSWFLQNSTPTKGLAVYGPNGGLIDSLFAPDPQPLNVRLGWYDARAVWTLDARGHWIGGNTARYSITVGSLGKSAVRVERPASLIPFSSTEVDNANAQRSQTVAGTLESTSPIPAKPQFLDVLVAIDGRVWVRVPGLARETVQQVGGKSRKSVVEDVLYDVYQADGRYLGIVELPLGASFIDASKERVWATVPGKDGEQYVVRFKLITTK